jgi:hypothetical protein
MANDYCEKMGRHLIVRGVDKQGAGLQAGVGIAITATVQFSCVTGDDPEYKQP